MARDRGRKPERLVHSEDTMMRVYLGLQAAGITGQKAIDAVMQMQNQGILFRQNDETPETPWVPLTVGPSKVIGKIFFDPHTGEIIGRLIEPQFSEFLNEVFGDGLMDVNFSGKPSIPSEEAQRKLQEFKDSIKGE